LWVTAPKGWLTLSEVWFVLAVELSLVVPLLLATYTVFVVSHIGTAEGDYLAVFVFVLVEFVLADYVVHLVSSSLALLCIL
jgi:hypothetical protein